TARGWFGPSARGISTSGGGVRAPPAGWNPPTGGAAPPAGWNPPTGATYPPAGRGAAPGAGVPTGRPAANPDGAGVGDEGIGGLPPNCAAADPLRIPARPTPSTTFRRMATPFRAARTVPRVARLIPAGRDPFQRKSPELFKRRGAGFAPPPP